MSKFATRFFLLVFVLVAFVGPFAAIVTLDKAKRAEKIIAEQKDVARAQKEAAAVRYQYYLDVNDRRNNLKQAMQDAKTQYEQLIKDQPALVKEKQTAVTQTVIKPVVTQKVVEQKVPATSTTSKPKSSSKTKSS
ncbi:MAG: hypothetical protein KBD27_03515 [Candidatus Moranbacteria bacterium]|nr:hypothetical protein [Candidatus Moranbacteria bacterium]